MSETPPSAGYQDRDAYMRELRQTLGDLERLLKEEPATSTDPFSGSRRSLPSQPVVLGGEDSKDLQLLMRFVTGALLLGAEELVERARHWEAQPPGQDDVILGGEALEDASYLTLARYWAIGMLAQGRRSAAGALRATLGTPDGLASSLLGLTDRVTGPFFMRPLRRPLTRMIAYAEDTSKEWISEGWREEQMSRWVAQNGVPEILEDVIHVISQNPELAELVRTQLSQQSMTMAGAVVDTSRRLSAVGDEMAENVARWLFRRGRRADIRVEPKADLPPQLQNKVE
jgi:hypothetical protein